MARHADPAITAQRRQDILDATVQCVIEKGFHAASMKEICRTAGISAGGLYRYFDSKNDIILALVREEQHENEELIEILESTPLFMDALKHVVTLMFQNYSDPDYGRFIIELMAEAGRNQAFMEIFQSNERALKQAMCLALSRAAKKGEINSRFSEREQAEFILALFDGFSARILLDPECKPETHIRTVMDNLSSWLLIEV